MMVHKNQQGSELFLRGLFGPKSKKPLKIKKYLLKTSQKSKNSCVHSK